MRAFSAILFGAALVCAQPAAISDSKKAAIAELSALTGTSTAMRAALEMQMQSMRGSMAPVVRQLIPKEGVSPAERARLSGAVDAMLERVMARMASEFSAAITDQRLMDAVFVPLYDKYFTEEDIRAMTEFYKTPAGHKMVEKMPLLMQSAGELAQETLVPLIEPIAKRIVEEESAKTLEDFKRPKPQQ